MKQGTGKRILAAVLSLILLVCAVPGELVVPASAASYRYNDVAVGVNGVTQEHFDAINYMFDNGVMIGTGEGNFSPNSTLTRAMAVTILSRLSRDPKNGSTRFQDIDESWYYDAVVWGEATGIVKGVSETEFLPYRNVQRREAITFLYRFVKYYSPTKLVVTGSIKDMPGYNEIEWEDAQEPMRWAVCNGILDSGHLKPQEEIDRKTFALYVHRMCIKVLGIQMQDRHYSENSVAHENVAFTNYYAMGVDEWNLLKNYIYSPYDDSFINNFWLISTLHDSVTDFVVSYYWLGSLWEGSCHGMASTCVLDKTGKIAFNENVAYNAETMLDVPLYLLRDSSGNLTADLVAVNNANTNDTQNKKNLSCPECC